MSAVNLSTVKSELKTIGCKLKSQLDGSWAICEPKGSRVIVATLEDAVLYYQSRSGHNAKAVPAKPGEAVKPEEASPQSTVASLKVRIEESRSKPNPFMATPVINSPAAGAGSIPAQQAQAAHTAARLPDAPVLSAVVPSVVDSTEADLRISTLKVELKSLGCQLKSQLDGSWAICEPKGNRVIVPTLEAVKNYCISKTTGPVVRPHSALATAAPAPVKVAKPIAAASPAVTAKESARPATMPDSQISEQQQLAIGAVNSLIRTIKDKRLAIGLNFLHSEIKPNLLKHGCPEALIDKAFNYAEAKLYKDCMDKHLVKRTFENHQQKNDVMYFDSRYAHLFAGE